MQWSKSCLDSVRMVSVSHLVIFLTFSILYLIILPSAGLLVKGLLGLGKKMENQVRKFRGAIIGFIHNANLQKLVKLKSFESKIKGKTQHMSRKRKINLNCCLRKQNYLNLIQFIFDHKDLIPRFISFSTFGIQFFLKQLLKIQLRRSGIIIAGCQIYKSSDQLSANNRGFTSRRILKKTVKPRLFGEYVASSGFSCCYWRKFLVFGHLERGEVKETGRCTPSEIKRMLNVKLYFSCLRMLKMIFVLSVGEPVGIGLSYVLMINLFVITYLKSEEIKKKGGGSSSVDKMWIENMLGREEWGKTKYGKTIFNFLKQGVKAGKNIAYDILGNGCKRSENERSKEFEVGNGNRRKPRVETDIHKTVTVRNSKNSDQMTNATSIATVGEANTKNQQSGTANLTIFGGMFFLLGFTFGSVYSEYKWAPVKICDSSKISILGV